MASLLLVTAGASAAASPRPLSLRLKAAGGTVDGTDRRQLS
jgi:hypothetical protein